jgi:hypothetical protein
MDMLRHDDPRKETKARGATDLLDLLNEQILDGVWSEERQSPVAGEGEESRLSRDLVSMELLPVSPGHVGILRRTDQRSSGVTRDEPH